MRDHLVRIRAIFLHLCNDQHDLFDHFGFAVCLFQMRPEQGLDFIIHQGIAFACVQPVSVA